MNNAIKNKYFETTDYSKFKKARGNRPVDESHVAQLKRLIAEKRVMYDHNIDQKGYKWSGKSILKKIEDDELPDYIYNNLDKYKDWLD